MSKSAFKPVTVGLPINKVEDTEFGKRYLVDISEEVIASFIQRKSDDAIFIEMIFNAAGVKVPADDPRAPGVAIMKAIVPMSYDEEDKSAVRTINEGIELLGLFSGDVKKDLMSGRFMVRIPVKDAKIVPWEETHF